MLDEYESVAEPETEFEAEPVDPSQMYWAARPARELVSAIFEKERRFFDAAERRGHTNMWRIIYAQHYGLDPHSLGSWETQSIGLDGEDGEQLRFRLNETRGFAEQVFNMWMGQRPSFKCSATNTDYSSLAQIETADAAVTYVYESKYGEQKERRLVEKGGLFGKSWTWVQWDPMAGSTVQEPVTLPDGTPTPHMQERKAGDLYIRQKGPWDVVEEISFEDEDEHCWRMLRDRRSRWELAAEYPEHAEKLRAIQGMDEWILETLLGYDDDLSKDEVVVKYFYHLPTKALPNGRYVGVVGDLVLWDLPMPYDELPAVEFCPSKQIGSTFGYSKIWDMCSINQMLDQVVSDIASNLSAFGRQVLVTDEGTDYDLDAIANGMRVLSKSPNAEMPQFMAPAAIPAASQWFVDYLNRRFESISGLNGVSRGDPGSNIKSGQMAALFHSIAIEINSAGQAAVDDHRTRVATLIVSVLKRYADHGFVVEIAGADERSYLSEFKKESLAGVKQVTVKTSPPMMRTQAGRTEIANMILQIPGAVQDPAQLVEVLVSGQIKQLYKHERSERLLIAWENEQLAKGQPVPCMVTDNPELHVPEHLALANSPSARMNNKVMQAVNAHVMEHLQNWTNLSPTLAQLLKINMPQIMAPGMPTPGVEDGAQEPAGPVKPPKKSQPTDMGVKLPKPSQSPVANEE